jgi:predicted dehydrogenase
LRNSDSKDTYFATGCKLNFKTEGGYGGDRHRNRRRRLHGQGACGGDVGRRRGVRHRPAATARNGLPQASGRSAERYRAAYGFSRATRDWQELVADPQVEAVIIASPQSTHRAIAEAAFALGKPVFAKSRWAQAWTTAAPWSPRGKERRGQHGRFQLYPHPGQPVRPQLIAEGAIGDITWFRGEHTEDFYRRPASPGELAHRRACQRHHGRSRPAHDQRGPGADRPDRSEVMAEIETVHANRPGGGPVDNDDQGQMMCRFDNGAMGHMYFSRIATGRKMGYAYEITGTKGAIRFDQEDQNALWLYRWTRGRKPCAVSRKILTGPAHPDYLPFCQGPGHGTGYQDQIIIEATDFLPPSIPANPSGRPSATGWRSTQSWRRPFASSRTKTWQT